MHPRFLLTKLTVAVLCFYTLNSLHYDLGHLGLLQMHPMFLLTKVTYSRPMLLHLNSLHYDLGHLGLLQMHPGSY